MQPRERSLDPFKTAAAWADALYMADDRREAGRRAGKPPRRRAVVALVLGGALLVGVVSGVTWSAFSGSTGSSGNTFKAASTFGEQLDHFQIDPIGTQQSGRAFSVTVRAKGASGATLTSYNGTVTFSTNSGTVATTTTNSFVNGVLEGQAVRITGDYRTDQTITVTGGSPAKTGTSAAFTLRDWKLYLKKSNSFTGSSCAAGSTARDMEEGHAGQDPEETFARTNQGNTLAFCSRTFSAGETLAAGTTRVEAWTSSVNGQGPCAVTASLYRNGSQLLGSNTQTIPQGTGTIFAKTWSISTPAVAFAAGDRLSLVLTWDTTAICREASFHFGGTARRSRLELPGPGGTAYSSSVLATPNLVSYWRLEEPSGTNAADSAGSNPGTHSTSSIFRVTGLLATAPVGTGVWFSGNTLSIPDSASLSPTGALSVEAWVDFASCCGNPAEIAAKDWRLHRLSAADGNRYTFGVDTGSGYEPTAVSTSSPTSANGFRAYLVGTYDGSNVKIYVNGQLEGTQPRTGAVVDGSGPLRLGGVTGALTQGHVDEVAFYNRALTASEVRAHWNAR